MCGRVETSKATETSSMSSIGLPDDDGYNGDTYHHQAADAYDQQRRAAQVQTGRYGGSHSRSMAKANGATLVKTGAAAGGPASAADELRLQQASNGVSGGAAPETAIDQALNPQKTTHIVGVPLTFAWTGPSGLTPGGGSKSQSRALVDKEVLSSVSVTPLVNVLQAKGLCPDQPINVSEVYLQKLHNASKSPLQLQVSGLNGRDLAKDFHQDGSWSTLVVHPEEKVDYTSMNNGRGLLLASNKLTSAAEVNVSLTAADILASAKPHTFEASGAPAKYLVDLDFSGFANNELSPAEQIKTLEKSPAGMLVFANAKAKIVTSNVLDPALVRRLPPLEPAELKQADVLPSLKIDKAAFGEPGHYQALIDGNEFRELVGSYESDNQAKATPTMAKTHQITVRRMNAGPKEHIGDISKELSVTQTDIDRNAQAQTGLHAYFNYVVQHNGTKYNK